MKSELTNNEMSIIIENSLVDYLRTVSKNGDRPFILNKKIGWVKTFPTAWSNYIFIRILKKMKLQIKYQG